MRSHDPNLSPHSATRQQARPAARRLLTLFSAALLALTSACNQPLDNKTSAVTEAADMAGPFDLSAVAEPGGPQVLSLGTNLKQMTEGEFLRVVAIVTHPKGLDQLAGGQLLSADGSIVYGPFVADRQGTYSLDVRWDDIHQTAAINFATEENRVFQAQFFDAAGRKTSQFLSVRLHCKGNPACNGACTPQGNQCKGGEGLCISGECKPGCYIGGVFTAPDAQNSDPEFGLCSVCTPNSNRGSWTFTVDGAPCGTNRRCLSGSCGLALQLKSTGSGTAYWKAAWASAPDDLYAVGYPNSTYPIQRWNGTGWSYGTPGTPTYMNGVWGSGKNNVFVVGNAAVVAKTTDSATTWTRITIPGATEDLNDVTGTGTTDLWVVGRSRAIYHSVDNGATWTRINSPVFGDLVSVWTSGPNDVWITNDQGTLLHTTDGGATFQIILFRSNSELKVWGLSKDDIYVLVNGGIQRTTDRGVTFTSLPRPSSTSSGIISIWGTSKTNLYALSTNAVYRSGNLGVSWSRQYLSSSNLRLVYGTSPSDIYVFTENYSYYRNP